MSATKRRRTYGTTLHDGSAEERLAVESVVAVEGEHLAKQHQLVGVQFRRTNLRTWKPIEMAPALSPKMVTLSGSPPAKEVSATSDEVKKRGRTELSDVGLDPLKGESLILESCKTLSSGQHLYFEGRLDEPALTEAVASAATSFPGRNPKLCDDG